MTRGSGEVEKIDPGASGEAGEALWETILSLACAEPEDDPGGGEPIALPVPSNDNGEPLKEAA